MTGKKSFIEREPNFAFLAALKFNETSVPALQTISISSLF